MPAPTNIDITLDIPDANWNLIPNLDTYAATNFRLKALAANTNPVSIGIGESPTEVTKIWELNPGEEFPITNLALVLSKTGQENLEMYAQGNGEGLIGFTF